MGKLLDTEIQNQVTELNNRWKHEGDSIVASCKFGNFIEAFSFMTNVAFRAEKMNHHPTWENTYNTVKINLSTHDVGGLSELDFNLAKAIDKILASK
jgi:4a-hydroxytetrahydrobiopterin dehydratase